MQVKRVAEILQISDMVEQETECSQRRRDATGRTRTRNGTSTESLSPR